MLIASFSAVFAALDILLGVVPGPAGICHHDRQDKAADGGSGQHAGHAVDSQHNSHQDRGRHSDNSRRQHFFLGGARTDIHTSFIVRLCPAVHQARDFPELPG